MNHPHQQQPDPTTTSWSGRRRSFPKAIARQILAAQPHCQLQLLNCTGVATEADHVLGHADALAAGWTPEEIDHPSNGQGLCQSCHAVKTAVERRRGQQRRQAAREQRKQRRVRKHPGLID